jgi:translation initiation factor 2 subunit 1
MMGNRVMFSMGSYKVDQHIDFLSKYKTYDVTIVDETNPKSAGQSNMIENFKAAEKSLKPIIEENKTDIEKKKGLFKFTR